MRHLEDVRVIPQAPRYQLNMELSQKDVDNIRRELRTYQMPGSSRYLLTAIIENIDSQ